MGLKIKIIIILLTFGTIFTLGTIVYKQNKKIVNLKQNTNYITKEATRYKIKDSLNVLSIQQLNLSIRQVKKSETRLYDVIDDLKVDKRRIQAIVSSQKQTIYNFRSVVRDSIVYVDKIAIDTIRCTEYHDKWLDFSSCTNKNDEAMTEIVSRDSLIYIEHIIPKRFLFIKWGIKERKQEIVSLNPHTDIVGTKFISTKK
jgi:hypothetical protein